MTYRELESLVINAIDGLYGTREARSVQRFLFSCFSGYDQAIYLLHRDEQADAAFEEKIMKAIPQLKDFMPVQYVTGKTWFCGYPFEVKRGVLIPRTETEGLVMMIADKYRDFRHQKILDIGTGSGAIAVCLSLLMHDARVEGIDNNIIALDLAKRNAEINKAAVRFSKIDILDENERKNLSSYHIIVSNPPYVRHAEKPMMRRNVLDFEPESALFVDDDDPLIYYRAIALFAKSHLEPGGGLWFEINETEGANMKEMLVALGFSDVEVYPDLYSKPRYVAANI